MCALCVCCVCVCVQKRGWDISEKDFMHVTIEEMVGMACMASKEWP